MIFMAEFSVQKEDLYHNFMRKRAVVNKETFVFFN